MLLEEVYLLDAGPFQRSRHLVVNIQIANDKRKAHHFDHGEPTHYRLGHADACDKRRGVLLESVRPEYSHKNNGESSDGQAAKARREGIADNLLVRVREV